MHLASSFSDHQITRSRAITRFVAATEYRGSDSDNLWQYWQSKPATSQTAVIGGELVDIRDLGPLGQLLSGLGTIVLAALGLWARQNYRRQVNLEQMKWLQQLYDSFYNSDRYKEVRQLIDFDELGQTMELLRQGDSSPHQLTLPDRARVDQFTDYLNFFEWLAFLHEEKQLTFAQLDTMFGYYLTRLLEVDKNRQLRTYIQEKGYEQLHRLLDRYSQKVSVLPAGRAKAAGGPASNAAG